MAAYPSLTCDLALGQEAACTRLSHGATQCARSLYMFCEATRGLEKPVLLFLQSGVVLQALKLHRLEPRDDLFL